MGFGPSWVVSVRLARNEILLILDEAPLPSRKTGDKDEHSFASMDRGGPFSSPGKEAALQPSESCKVGATPVAL
eukprot:10417884-Lingulodinium_polyedra.AAC.1